MSKKWAKEDRYSWDQSEVMKNFESQILSNYSFLEKKSQQLSTQKAKELASALSNAATAASKLKTDLKFLNEADDAIDMTAEYCESDCSYSDDEYSNSDVIKEELINELESMAQNAIDGKNIKLAYLIERTISELKEKDDE